MGLNVQIKNGSVSKLFTGSGVTANGAGDWKFKDSPYTTYHAVITGSGSVSATVTIEVSNDGINPCETVAATITLSGTGSSTDGFTTSAPWRWHRATVSDISGTGATVQVYVGV